MVLGSYPRLLALALSLPEISHAAGLGNIRVDSKLNEALSAQIDIVDATPDELKAIRASVASPETFQRYNAERPAFLSSATVTVGTDAAGKPVLNIRSTEAFTEPLVEFLIDLRSGHTELVRDYSLLLDPGRASPVLATAVAALPKELPAAPGPAPIPETPRIVLATAAAISVASPAAALEPISAPGELEYVVVAHDTLMGVARQAGARSELEQQRMMLAIFKGNPEAFAGNINILHRGALIRIPSAATIEVFDKADVEREIRAQMTAWRRGGRPSPRQVADAVALNRPEPAAPRAPTSPGPDASTLVAEINQLDGRMHTLQQTLAETSRQVDSANARLSTMERHTPKAAPVVRSAPVAEGRPAEGRVSLSAMLGGLALLFGGAVLAFRRALPARSPPRRPPIVEEPTLEAPAPDFSSLSASRSTTEGAEGYSVTVSVPELVVAAAPPASAARVRLRAADPDATMEMTQVTEIDIDTVEERAAGGLDELDTLVMDTLEPKTSEATSTELDYNLSDLDGRAQHVEMPGSLHEHAVVVERRKNVVDSLMAAIQRDPSRYDLRMKLLETLYTAASTNLRAFKEVVSDMARHPERLKAGEWEQIMVMGRHLAADDALFAEQAADDSIADCA
jgi:pilus assembly protein FimV